MDDPRTLAKLKQAVPAMASILDEMLRRQWVAKHVVAAGAGPHLLPEEYWQ